MAARKNASRGQEQNEDEMRILATMTQEYEIGRQGLLSVVGTYIGTLLSILPRMLFSSPCQFALQYDAAIMARDIPSITH